MHLRWTVLLMMTLTLVTAQDNALDQELAQEAGRRGLSERMDVQQALAQARVRILIQALQADMARELARPTDKEIEAEFRRNPGNYRLLEAVRADLFVLDGDHAESLPVARRALARQEITAEELQKTRFQQIALADQGVWVAKDIFPEEVWAQVKELRPGRVQFFPAENNVLLVRFQEHREEREATLEEARDRIRDELAQQRLQEAWTKYVEEQRRKLGSRAP
jgi:hypothetical protein